MSPRFSARTTQPRRNNAAVASRWRHCARFERSPDSGVATHWILWMNPGAANCDNILNEQSQSQ